MRIEFGLNETDSFIKSLNKVNSKISDSIGSMRKTIGYMNAASGNGVHLDTSGVHSRISVEQDKSEKITTLKNKVYNFAENTIMTDNRVGNSICTSFEDFIRKNEWAKPIQSGEKSWWDKFVDGWNDFWGSVGDWFSDALEGIINWVKEHAVEIIIGVVAITIGAAIIFFTGGAATPFVTIFLGGLKVAGLSALSGGAINSVIALFTGQDPLKAFGDGLAEGFMWGGIFFVASATFSALKQVYNAKKVAKGAGKGVRTSNGKKVSASSSSKTLTGTNTSSKPLQEHHFASNKSKKYTSQFENITNKYGLDLNGDWNKALMPHQGRHPYAYHDYILDNMQKFDMIAKGDQSKFLKLFDQMKNKIIQNPEMLYKNYWKK